MICSNITKLFGISLLILVLLSNHASFAKIDETKTIIWGPGLDPENIVLQARYIFLQLVDDKGFNITQSQGKGIIHFTVSGSNSKMSKCRVVTETLDCQDGSYILRYRLHETCYNLQIIIKVDSKLLPLKNKYFEGPVYHEDCYCPNPSLQSWMITNNCNQNDTKIFKSLEEFSSVDFDVIRQHIIDRYDKPNSVSVCHYVIKDNQIYRRCYGQHVGFKMFTDAILLSITRKVVLQNMEFFTNLGDWPLVPKNEKIIHPMFSWCGTDDHYDIILPTYDITESSLESMGRVMLDMLSVQGREQISWEKKIPKMFWRGRDSNRLRFRLIDIARENPDLFNASMTNFFFFNDEIEKYGPAQKPISFFEFFKYKYQVTVDGTVASYRFPYLLAGNSLTFKQNSKYHEYFYEDLEPEVHFISVKNDLSDLVSKLKWAMNNDDAAQRISRNGKQFARDNLMPDHVVCYHAVMFEEWSKRLKSNVKVLPGMELVQQPADRCTCISKEHLRDEL